MDAGQDGIDLTVSRHGVDQALRHDLAPALTLVELGDWLDVAGLDILAEQLPARMDLPGVWRIPAGQAGL